MNAVSKRPRPRGARHARRTLLRWARGKIHAKCLTCTLFAGQSGRYLARTARRLGQPCVWGIRIHPTLGQKPLGQRISQTERAISFRNAMHDGVPVAGVQKTTKRAGLGESFQSGSRWASWLVWGGWRHSSERARILLKKRSRARLYWSIQTEELHQLERAGALPPRLVLPRRVIGPAPPCPGATMRSWSSRM